MTRAASEMGIVITHGPDPAFETAAAMHRAWTDALQLGLLGAGVAEPRSIDIRFAPYGDVWFPGHPTAEDASPGASLPASALGGGYLRTADGLSEDDRS